MASNSFVGWSLTLDAPFEIEPESGVLKFAQISLTLVPEQTLAAFLATDAGANAEDGGSNEEFQRYILRNDLTDGRVLGVSLSFMNRCLARVRFDYRPKSECDWSTWSEKRELIRTDDYRNEIVRQLGRRGRFDWGVVDAAYDDKAASAFLFVKYE